MTARFTETASPIIVFTDHGLLGRYSLPQVQSKCPRLSIHRVGACGDGDEPPAKVQSGSSRRISVKRCP